MSQHVNSSVPTAADLARHREVRASMEAFQVRDTPAIRAARAYGIDISLLKLNALLTPAERLRAGLGPLALVQ